MATRKRSPAPKAARAARKPPAPRTLQVRWKNFRGFVDTDWLQLRPLTVIIGPNNTGKTSLLAPLLLLKQTLEMADTGSPLITDGDLVHAGPFSELLCEHDTTNPMVLGIRFDYQDPPNGVELPVLGAVPPGVLEVALEMGPTGAPLLTRYTVSDRFGRVFLDRSLNQNGEYSVESMPKGESDRKQMALVTRSQPERFLFSARGPLSLALDLDKPNQSAPSVSKDPIQFSGRARLYLAIVDYIRELAGRLLNAISYIGPIRSHPKRVYPVGSDPVTSVGVTGEHAAELLFTRFNGLSPTVNKWANRLEFGHRLECKELTKGAFQLLVQRESGVPVNFADTGFGISQALPILVQAAAAKAGETLIVEQPEIHLNPRLQYELADLFAETVEKGCRVLVETHSEHMFLRMRRLLAEGKLKPANVTVLYVEKVDKRSIVREVPILADGSISSEDWPTGFFEDSLKEALALAMAQAVRGDK